MIDNFPMSTISMYLAHRDFYWDVLVQDEGISLGLYIISLIKKNERHPLVNLVGALQNLTIAFSASETYT